MRSHRAPLTLGLGLLTLLALLPSGEVEARKGKKVRFRVMTFNIRFDFPSDAAQGNSWAQRRDLVAKTFKLAKAELAGTQEDKGDQVQDLRERLPDWECYAGKGRNGGSGEHCAIWWKREAFRQKDQGDFWLSDTPQVEGSNTWGDKYPRKVTWVLLEPKAASDKPVLVLNAHFPEGNRTDLREKGAAVMRRFLEERLGSKGLDKITVLSLGDYNADADESPRKVLAEGLLRDAWVESNVAHPAPGTFCDFKGLRTRERIDWILIGGPGRAVGADKMDEQIDGRWASDHYAVCADIEIR